MRNPYAPHPTRRHHWDPRRFADPLPAPTPTVDVVNVAVDHGTEFNWVVYWEFSGPIPDALTLADLAGLTVAGGAPASIDERGDDWLMLLYHTDSAAGETWLVQPGGSPIFVPGQTGVVGEL